MTSGIAIRHIPTPDFNNSPGDLAVNKEYVDQRDELLRQDIIELEEEIDALAPSLERGVWASVDKVGPGNGEFSMSSILGGVVESYEDNQVAIIIFNNEDSTGTEHAFSDVESGQLIQLLDQEDEDYGLFEIVSVTYNTGNTAFDVAYIQGRGEATFGESARIKIFEKPTGGTSSEFVLKTGDELSGRLKFETDQETISYVATDAKARLTFENTKSDGSVRAIHLFQPGPASVLVATNDFRSKGNLYTDNFILGWDTNTGDTYSPSIRLDQDAGYLRYDTKLALYWGDTGVSINKMYDDDNTGSGFTVQGAIGSNYSSDSVTNQTGSLLEAYHNANKTDSIKYRGRIVGDNDIVTKKYVDDNSGGVTGNCIKLNDGKLCAGEPMPRFYKIPDWSETQKSSGTAHPTGIQTPYYWAVLDRWVYTVKVNYNSSTKAKAHLKIYLSKTNNMHDGFDHWTTFTARYEDHYSTVDFLGVTGNYIWIYQYLGASSSNNNTKYAGIQSVKTDKTIRDHVWSSSLSGFSVGWVFIDNENNFCCRVQKAKYSSNTGFTYTHSLFFHNDETGYETTVNPQYLSGAPADTNDARPFEQVHRDQGNTSDVKGFYWFAGKMSGYNIRYLSSHEMYYFDPDDNFRSTKCTAAMPYGVNYFKPSYNTSTGTVSYKTTSSINFDNGLGSTHAKISTAR